MGTKFSKIMFLFLLIGLCLGTVSSEWYFDSNEYNLEDISNESTSVFAVDLMANVTDGDDVELSPADIANFTSSGGGQDDNTYVVQEYSVLNSSTGNSMRVNETLNYHEGFDVWYAEFETNDSSMENLTLKARGDTDISGTPNSDGEDLTNISVDFNDERPELLDVNLDYDFSDPIKADRDFKADVQVINSSTGNVLNGTEVTVSVYFHNMSEKEEEFTLGNYNDDEDYHFNSEVRTPEETDSQYIFRILANESGNTVGTESMIVETAPAINGETVNIQSPGCEDIEVSEECDPGAEIDTEFDITAASAEGVNLTLYQYNSSSDEWNNHSLTEMTEVSANDGAVQTFEASHSIPDLDTSKFDKKVKLEYFAWNQDRKYVENHTIDLKSFVVEDRSNPTAFKTREHEIQLFLGEKFSRDSFDKSRFSDLQVNVSGGNYTSNHTMDDFEFNEGDGTFENTIVIPEDASTGAYELDILVNDTYGEVKEVTRGLQVRDVNATFTADSDLEVEYDSLGEFTENIGIENLVDSEKTLDIYNENENITIPNEVTISANQEEDVSLDINITSPGSFEAEIEFADSSASYNETTMVDVQGPDCQLRDEDLCVDNSNINLQVEETGEEVEEQLTVTNLGDNDIDVNTSITGNASEVFSVEGNNTVSESGFESWDIIFSPDTSGTYEGDLELETDQGEVSIELTGETEFGQVSAGLEANPPSIDIGTVPQGEEGYETELTIENTGDVSINSISADTGGLDLEIEEFDLSSGGSKTLDLSIPNPQSATLNFEGESSEGNVSVDVQVNADVIEDYSQRTDELRDRMNNLRSQTDDPDLEEQLSQVSGMVDQINSQWDSGSYEEAQSTFEEAQSTLDSVDSQIGGSDPNEPNNDDTQEGSGVPILPIISILFVLIIIGGFVFYESYIPEEGDPLYGVLGE